MKNKILIIAISVLFAFSACQTDEIEAFDGDNYIYFTQEGEDQIDYSFSFNPGKDQDTIQLEVSLVGNAVSYDRQIDLTVNDSATTASSSDYTLPSVVLRAEHYTDTISVILYNSDKLSEKKDTLYLEISDNDDLLCGPSENSFVKIVFSDMISKPDWWTETVTNSFLGEYSDTKYKLFIEATGISDMTDFSESEIRAYALIFRDFLAEGRENGEEYVDENGNAINVPDGLNF